MLWTRTIVTSCCVLLSASSMAAQTRRTPLSQPSPLPWTPTGIPFTSFVFGRDVDVGDMDGDGHLDVLSSATGIGPCLSWHRNAAGDGSTWTSTTIPFVGYSGGQTSGLSVVPFSALGDIDGDGDLDVLSSGSHYQPSIGSSFRALAWHENLSGDGSSWVQHDIRRTTCSELALADLDGDGDLDAVVSDVAGAIATTWIYTNDSGDGSAWTRFQIPDGTSSRFVAPADVDGDGDMDIVATYASSGIVWHDNAVGDASTWIEREIFASGGGFTFSFVVPADVDGDGDTDAFSLLPTGELAWHENVLGDGTSWTQRTVLSNQATLESLAVRDMDADGDLDALGTTEEGTVAWVENLDGDGTDWASRLISPPSGSGSTTNQNRVAAADLDGDGDMDALHTDAWEPILGLTWFRNPQLVVPYGSGVNPDESLALQDLTPEIGETMVFAFDNPLGTQSAGALSWFFLSLEPNDAFPGGTLFPNVGMAGPGARGELLVSVLPSDLLLGPFFAGPWPGPGTRAELGVAIPLDPNLIGLKLFAQGLLQDLPATFGVPYGLTNALRVTISEELP